MSELPDKRFLRRGEVRAYLAVSEHVLTQMVAAGTLRPIYLTGKGRAFFGRDEVAQMGKQQTKGIKGL